MKKIIFLILSGCALLGVVIGIKSCSSSGAAEVATEKAERRTIIETVSANGKIQPEVAVKISPDVSGEIVELNVKEGQKVQKGDLILKIRPDLYISAVERVSGSLNTSKANFENSRARLAQAKAQFGNSESSFNRNKKLFDQGAISQSDFDNAKASYESAKAEVDAAEKSVMGAEYTVKSAEASLKESNDNLARTTIYAPVSGTISKLNVELGERVVGTTQMAGTEMLTIANLTEMEARVDVNENDIVRVHMNDTALIEVDAYLGRKFKGLVTEIANSANTSGVSAEQVTNFTVKIRLIYDSYKDLINDKNLNPFRPGMSASVDIQTKMVQNVISLPITAVTTRADSTHKKMKDEETSDDELVVKNEKDEKAKAAEKNDNDKPKECVFIYADGKAKKVFVKIGVQDNNYIEITEGIKEGDEVISGPYTAVSKLLRDGSNVTKVDKKELYKPKKD